MPVHHLLERILDETLWWQVFREGNPCSKVLIRLERSNRTSFEPLQRLGRHPKAGQGSGLSHACRMSYLAGNRHHDLPGERRTARARPTDGRA
jgi:hypothetical protein